MVSSVYTASFSGMSVSREISAFRKKILWVFPLESRDFPVLPDSSFSLVVIVSHPLGAGDRCFFLLGKVFDRAFFAIFSLDLAGTCGFPGLDAQF